MSEIRQHTMPPAPDQATPEDALRFDSERLCAALAYHLREVELEAKLDARIVQALLQRVKGLETYAVVKRSDWVALTNPQRLQWLLTAAQAEVVELEGGAVPVASRRDR